jgi:hypothetical protein
MTSEFIALENVERFLTMLRNPEIERETHKTLQKLLVAEQDKLARNREQLELADRWVCDGKARIRELRRSLASSNCADWQHSRRLALIATMEETQALLEDFRRKLRDELYPFCIMLQHTMVGVTAALDEARLRAQAFAKANPELVVTIIDRANGGSHVVRADP